MKINTMGKILLIILSILCFTFSFGQQTEKLAYCNCTDQVDQLTPALEGKFERSCNGKIIETGYFKGGKKNGEWITYNKKGLMIRKMNYLDGKLDGKCEIFFTDGTPKLTANFKKGLKVDKWTYFTSKGKVFISGEFEDGTAKGIWTINDKKGRAPAIQYDFSTSKYLMNGSFFFHRDGDIIQNDNTEEYYILRYPRRAIGNGSAPIGGMYFAGDLFVELMEVPLDYWDTYANYKYTAKFATTPQHKTTFSLETIEDRADEYTPIFPFIIKTNRDAKLKNINHSKLSKQLLDFKIEETLNLLPPWRYKSNEKTEVYIPYVINDILGF
jgi:hypothetical protein